MTGPHHPPERSAPTAAAWPAGLVAAYEERWLPLTRLAYLLTGNRAVAEELVQDVFVRARPAWDRIDQPAGYLRTAVSTPPATGDGAPRWPTATCPAPSNTP